jgi:hypothetical protein
VQCPAWHLQLLTAEYARKEDIKDDKVISKNVDKDTLRKESDNIFNDVGELTQSIFKKWIFQDVPDKISALTTGRWIGTRI